MLIYEWLDESLLCFNIETFKSLSHLYLHALKEVKKSQVLGCTIE